MDYSLPGSSIHGIFQARVQERVAISFSRGSSWPRDRTWVSCIVGRCFYRLSYQGSPIYIYIYIYTHTHTYIYIYMYFLQSSFQFSYMCIIEISLSLFWPQHVVYGILVPWPEIEPAPLALKAWSPNHWITRELPPALTEGKKSK